MSKKIVLTGGGTAGHVMPNIALLEHLKYHFNEIIYIGSEKGIERQLIHRENIPYFSVPTVKLERSLTLKNLKIPFILIKAIREAKTLLLRIKPDLIFSKGGFVAVPVVMAAKKLGIPVIIHESDLTMGLANKLSKRYAQKTLVTFPESQQLIEGAVFTGVPIRSELSTGMKRRAREKLELSTSYPTILIMGGSIGSKKINEVVNTTAQTLTRKYNVIHICGKNNLSSLKLPRYRQVEFTSDIADLFDCADLVVSRSGSNTIHELLYLKKPMLLVPLSKKASRGDQIENAECFAKKGYAQILYEEKLDPQNFTDAIDLAFNDRHKMSTAMTKAKSCDGIKNVLTEILKYVT